MMGLHKNRSDGHINWQEFYEVWRPIKVKK